MDAFNGQHTGITSYQLCMHHGSGNQLNYRYNSGQTFSGHAGSNGNTHCYPCTNVNGIIVQIYLGTTLSGCCDSVGRVGFTLGNSTFVVTGVDPSAIIASETRTVTAPLLGLGGKAGLILD